jgi:sugar phosphate isomerase/epimerase
MQQTQAGIFLAQMKSDSPPFNTLEGLCRWAAELGYTCVQIPGWDADLINLKRAAESKDYCDDYLGKIRSWGLVHGVSEIATHLQGQLTAVHPAYVRNFSGFAPENLRKNPEKWRQWAVDQLKLALKASHNMGLKTVPSFSGSFLWPYIYPWPQLDQNMTTAAFRKLGEIWQPVFDYGGELGVSIAFELHPGEDLHSGATFERFLTTVKGHAMAKINLDVSHFILMALDYLKFIRLYADRIAAFHAKDAELVPNGREGVYSFASWAESARRFRSLGDGQVDFKAVKHLFDELGINVPWVLEWEDCFKKKEQGAREGAPFIKAVLEGRELPEKQQPDAGSVSSFDDFAKAEVDQEHLSWLFGEKSAPEETLAATAA